MPRPKKPLISRTKTIKAALKIIDEEGLEALTIRRLGSVLNVRGISLYHHFENKEAILVAACEYALADVRTPTDSNSKTATRFTAWLLRNAENYHQALCDHPNLIPILTKRHPLRIGLKELNSTLGLLSILGIPNDAIMEVMEALEILAVGSASYQYGVNSEVSGGSWTDSYPVIDRLIKNHKPNRTELFNLIARASLDAILEKYGIDEAAVANIDSQPSRNKLA